MNDNEIKAGFGTVSLIVLIVVALVGGGGYLYGKNNKVLGETTTTTTAPSQVAKATVTIEQIKQLFDGKNITFGNKDSKIVFVEFSDPSCPYCHVAAGKNSSLNKRMGAQFVLKADGGEYVAPVPEMKKLVDDGKAAFVWIYANGHGNGELATKALYCAQEKGKFWEAHDLLMNTQGYELINTTVKNDKTQSGEVVSFLKSVIDPNFMKSCLDSGKYDDRPGADMATAQQFGFNGTPSFFVNTQNFAGAYSYTDIQPMVDQILK